MPTKMQPNISTALQDISDYLEYAFIQNARCYIGYEVFSKWTCETLGLLEKYNLICKEKSKRQTSINCFCGDGEILTVQYEDGKSDPFAQCFKCNDLRSIDLIELEYYESSSLFVAKFLSSCIEDMDDPTQLIRDQVFFVGELFNSKVLVYFSSTLQKDNVKKLYKACEDHARGQVFIVIINHIPIDIPKKYKLLSITDKRLLSCNGSDLILNIDYINETFVKCADKQEAANARWEKDSKKQAINKVTAYVQANINNWPCLNHVEIKDRLREHNQDMLKYTDSNNQKQIIKDNQLLKITALVLREGGEGHRVSGSKESREAHFEEDLVL